MCCLHSALGICSGSAATVFALGSIEAVMNRKLYVLIPEVSALIDQVVAIIDKGIFLHMAEQVIGRKAEGKVAVKE